MGESPHLIFLNKQPLGDLFEIARVAVGLRLGLGQTQLLDGSLELCDLLCRARAVGSGALRDLRDPVRRIGGRRVRGQALEVLPQKETAGERDTPKHGQAENTGRTAISARSTSISARAFSSATVASRNASSISSIRARAPSSDLSTRSSSFSPSATCARSPSSFSRKRFIRSCTIASSLSAVARASSSVSSSAASLLCRCTTWSRSVSFSI